MLKLHVIQAKYGDCFIVQGGTEQNPFNILVDGGPSGTYEHHLREELKQIADAGGKLDLIIASHVDNDHIAGLLDLLAEREQQLSRAEDLIIDIQALWHNTFSQTVGQTTDIELRLETAIKFEGIANNIPDMPLEIGGIREGHDLTFAATSQGIPLNPQFDGQSILVDIASSPLNHSNLSLRVVGPTQETLDALREEWEAWLNEQFTIADGDMFDLSAMSDTSTPNLSSIMLLIEAEGKKLLLTGDGRGDHLLQGLTEAGLLEEDGTLHVDVFKVPHHGSDRNVTRRFFKSVTADHYVISANGRYGNPDLATFIWIVEAAHEVGRPITIWLTNETTASRKLEQEYPPEVYRYKLVVMDVEQNKITIEFMPDAVE